MTILSKLFGSGAKKIDIQTYGKLPFYKDYINLVTTSQGINWRNWILGLFGQNNMNIPVGIWPFIFQGGYGNDIIVGLIEPSSDSLRTFPFSVFVELKLSWVKKDRSIFSQVIKQLKFINSDLNRVTTIDECYGVLGGHAVKIENAPPGDDGYHDSRVGVFNESVLSHPKGSHPLFFVASNDCRSVHLIFDNTTSGQELIANWNERTIY